MTGTSIFPATSPTPRQVEALARRVIGAEGVPDVVVSNAGGFLLEPLEHTTPADFDAQIGRQPPGAFLRRPGVPARDAGGGRGSFISVGSVADHVGFPENAAYAASKYGLRGLHETLLAEYRGTGVRLTLVSPGPTDTTIWDPFDPERRPGFPSRAAMLRPDDVADAVSSSPLGPPTCTSIGSGCNHPDARSSDAHSLPHRCLTRSRPRIRAFASASAGACVRSSCPCRSPLPLIGTAAAQGALPALPDSTGWGVHVLAVARDPGGTLWVGTYGQGIYRLSRRRHRLGADPPRHHRHVDLLGFRAGDRLRAAGPDLVRHHRERLGPLDGRRGDLEELDLQAAGTRVAVRGAGGHRRPGRHHGDRDGRRAPDHHRRRRALDRDRGLAPVPPRRARPTPRSRCSRTSTCGGSPPTSAAGTSPRSAASSGCGKRRGLGGRAAEARGVSSARLGAIGGQPYRGDPVRPRGPRGTRLPVSPAAERAAEAPRVAAHHLAQAADRAARQRVHRPDLPLRLDHGRQLPAAPGRRVQQSRRHAGARRRPGTVVLRRAGGGRGADRHHPPRHHGHRERDHATGSTRPTTTTRP